MHVHAGVGKNIRIVMENNMEKMPNFLPSEEMREFEGAKYRKVPSGYTLRQYYSHTSEKGPGPGWDSKWSILEKYGVNDPKDLPDEPYYTWELLQ